MKSRAILVIAALVLGTIISTGVHQILTSRNTDGESASQPNATDTLVDSLAGKGTPNTNEDPLAGDSEKESDESAADDSEQSKVAAYERKIESLYAKLDDLKAKRQAIRDRIQFD